MCTLSSFVKQGTLAELEIDKTGEEQHRVLQARLSQQQPLKKKNWQVLSHYCQYNQLLFFDKYIFLLESCREIFKVKEVNKTTYETGFASPPPCFCA